MIREKSQLASYVEAVTGSCPPSSSDDCAKYLYSIVSRLNSVSEMMSSSSSYQWKLARQQIISISDSLLVNAKYYEGIPIQGILF